MPMGVVSDKEFEAEIEKSRIVNSEFGRGKGNPNTPESLRKIIGENSVEEGRNGTKALTRAFGISDSSLSAYANGATSCATYNQPNKDLANHVNKMREKIVKKARNRLHCALNGITPEKLADEKPRDLAAIAKDMSSIIKDFEPRTEGDSAPKALIIFAPQLAQESKFEVIDMKEI
jgi:hypothetical protein